MGERVLRSGGAAGQRLGRSAYVRQGGRPGVDDRLPGHAAGKQRGKGNGDMVNMKSGKVKVYTTFFQLGA